MGKAINASKINYHGMERSKDAVPFKCRHVVNDPRNYFLSSSRRGSFVYIDP